MTDQVDITLDGSALAITVQANPMVICNTGEPVQLNAVATGGNSSVVTIWTWSVAGIPFSSLQNPIVNPVITTTYSVVVNDGFNTAGPATTTVTVNPLPLVQTLNGGGAYCEGDPGVLVGLNGSETGITYQLMHNAINIGTPVAGSGNAISFGLQTNAGAYTVLATNTTTFCINIMAGSVNVIIDPLPLPFTVTGGGNYPAGGSGVNIGLSGSQTGISYQLFVNGVASGIPLTGTGNALSFGLQTADGNYTVVGTNLVTLCFVTMTGSATVVINPLPLVYEVTGGGERCFGSAGLPVGLNGSESGIDYQLLFNAIPVGVLIHGTGLPLAFGLFTNEGNYTVQGINPVTLAPNMMNGSATIIEHPLPVSFNIIPAGSHCSGTALGTNGSQSGVNYTLLLNGSIPVSTIAGTGTSLDFGPQATDGTYTVYAEDAITFCPKLMTGTSIITPLPVVYNVTPAGNNCSTAILGLDGSQTGVRYELFKNGITTGITLGGNGNPVSFGIQPVGTYTVNAVITATGCVNSMSGSIVVSPPPVSFAGVDASSCGVDAYTVNGQASNFLNYVWTSPGDGWFDDPGVLNAVYHPGTNDTTIHSIVLTLTVNGTAGCTGTSISDNVKLSFDPLPVAIAGSDGTACAIGSFDLNGYARNHYNVTWHTSGNGYFSNSGSLISTYIPGTGDAAAGNVTLTLVALGQKTCINKISSDDLILTIDPLPQVDAGLNRYNCMDNPATLEGIASSTSLVVWSTDGDGTFIDNQVINAIYTPGAGDVAYGSVQLHLKGFGTATCTDISVEDSVVLTIMEFPTAFASYNQPNCANEVIQFDELSFTLYGYIEQYIWNYGDGSLNDTINFPDDPNLTHQYSQPGRYVVTLYITNSFGCQDNYVFPVDVIPNPIANYYFDGNCDGQVVKFQNASFANGPGNLVAWRWDFDDPASGINNTSDIEDPEHVFSGPGSYYVSLIATNYNNCSDTMTKLITINPLPLVDFIHSPVCLESPAFFNPDPAFVNIPFITGWNWDFGDGITSNEQNSIHQYNAPGTYTVTFTITDSLGCFNSISREIIVNPLPVAHYDAGTDNCSGSNVTFTNYSNSPSGYIVQWIWDFGDGNSITVLHPGNPTVTHIYNQEGIYPVLLSVQSSDSCWSSELQQIVIKPGAVANFDYTSPPCSEAPVSFTDLTQNNGGGSIVAWSWNFGDPASASYNTSAIQNPEHEYGASGLYTVMLHVTLANGCSSEVEREITVSPVLPVDFISDIRCEENPVQFQPDASVVDIPSVTEWLWDFGDGFTSGQQTPVHVYPNPGNYQVTLTITDINSCKNSITKAVVIIPKPIAAFGVSTPICSQASSQFTDLSSAPLGYIIKWHWDFGDGTTHTVLFPAQPDVSHLYANYGTFTVSLTVTTGDSCSNTITNPVVVKPNPLADFSYGGTCRNEAVQFDDLSQSGSGGLIQWQWDFGDPASGSNNISTLQNAIHLYSSAGIYTVKLIAVNTEGCSDTAVKQLTIHELPVVNFTSEAGCENDSTHFISSGFVNANATVSRLWEFGDGFTSPEIDPYHIYASTGVYSVTLTVTDTAGCVNTKTSSITITPPPLAFFQVSAYGCTNNPLQFDDLSIAATGQISSWMWDFGDGNDTLILAPSNPDISHIYSLPGSYVITLKIVTQQGCENEYTRPVTVLPGPGAEFSYTNTCVNTAVDFTNLTNTNGGTVLVNFLWNFGDPVSGINNTSDLENPLHIYSSAGDYLVLLLVVNSDGCTDTISHQLSILPKPLVDYSWANTCVGMSTQFSVDLTVTNVAAVEVFEWDFGDGSPHVFMQDPQHSYATNGSYNVVLSITDTAGCISSKSYPVVINPQPTALFSYSASCLNSMIQFIDESFSAGGELITGWNWDFGVTGSTTDTSTLRNPSWVYASVGQYNVNLITTTQNGCQDTLSIPVQVAGLPEAGFVYTASPCKEGVVYFQDSSFCQSSSIVQWYWQFSPTQFSTVKDPVFVFPATDSCYTVKMIVTTTEGCTDTIVKQVCVPESFKFSFANSSTCIGSAMEFTPQIVSPVTDSLVFFNWDFGDPASGINNVSTLRLPSHTYSEAGVYMVSLTAVDIHNCHAKEYRQVMVSELPAPAFSFSGSTCDSIITFRDITNNHGVDPQRLIWNYGDGHSDTLLAPFNPEINHTYAVIGEYLVTLTSKNANGCEESVTDTVRYFPCLFPAFAAIDTLLCQNYTITFADSSTCGGTISSWEWDFGDGSTQSYTTYTNPVIHSYTAPGQYQVRLKISTQLSDKSTSDSIVTNILVNPVPSADFNSGLSCIGSEVRFTNTTLPGSLQVSRYNWFFNDPLSVTDTSSARNPGYYFPKSGSYEVQLVAVNTAGCQDTIVQKIVVHNLPEADFGNTIACAGHKTSFINQSDSTEAPITASTWRISDNSGIIEIRDQKNPEITFPDPGSYVVYLQVADSNGCTDTISKQVEAWPNPISSFIYHENYENVQGQLQFENGSVNAVEYFWDFGNGETSYLAQPIAMYQNDGKYTIELITWTDKSCTDTISGEYIFLAKGLFVPNAFSPGNPHGEVILFKPVGINLMQYRFEIYDRWDNLLWWTEKLDAAGRPVEGWNGTYNGIDAPIGNYIWKASAIFKDGSIWEGNSVGKTDNLSTQSYGTFVLIK